MLPLRRFFFNGSNPRSSLTALCSNFNRSTLVNSLLARDKLSAKTSIKRNFFARVMSIANSMIITWSTHVNITLRSIMVNKHVPARYEGAASRCMDRPRRDCLQTRIFMRRIGQVMGWDDGIEIYGSLADDISHSKIDTNVSCLQISAIIYLLILPKSWKFDVFIMLSLGSR